MGGSRPDPALVNKIFGSDSPRESSDERDADASRQRSDRDQWIQDNRPPHHN